MKIAFIGQKGMPARYGGVERHVEELAARLAKNGHEVFAYVRNNYTDKNLAECRGVKLIHLPSIPTKNLDAISHTLLATIHAIFHSYDVVHYHSIGPISLTPLFKLFKRKTILVATYHSQDYQHKKWGVFARFYLRFGEYVACFFPDKTIAISKNLGDYVWKKFRKRVAIIYNGMQVSPVEKCDKLDQWNIQRGGYILSVSRFVPHKGIHFLIEAYKSLEDKHLTRGKKLVIVGDGFYTDDYVNELKDAARGRENIIFTGAQTGEALEQLFSHAYLFVQPSESEGLSLALLEAMGYGRAIVVSNIKENLEAIEPGTGVAFKSGDWHDLENKLVYMINNPALAKELGENAMIRAKQKYSWDKIAAEIENLYADIFSQKRKKVSAKSYERNI